MNQNTMVLEVNAKNVIITGQNLRYEHNFLD